MTARDLLSSTSLQRDIQPRLPPLFKHTDSLGRGMRKQRQKSHLTLLQNCLPAEGDGGTIELQSRLASRKAIQKRDFLNPTEKCY